MPGRRGCLVAVLSLVLTACGSGSSVATRSQETTSSTTETTIEVTSTTSAAPTSTTRAGPSTTRPRPQVTLPAGGPSGPVDPPGTPAYQLLTKGGNGCQELLAAVERWPRASAANPEVNGVEDRLFYLYRGAARACLLRWADAKADFDRLQALRPGPTFGTTCSSDEERYCERCHRLVLDWLTGQLAAFRSDPAYAPTFMKSTSPSPCPGPTSSTSTTRAVTTTTRR